MTLTKDGGRPDPDTESEAQDFAALDFAEMRRRRAELLESINALEQALAAPGLQARWGERVSAAVMELASDFHEHMEITEGPVGLYTQVIGSSPRLAHQVDRLTQEHVKLGELMAELVAAVGKSDTSNEPEEMLGDHAEVRERGTKLLGALVRHRQRGADMMYEAYSVDIGGQD
jgi:hypothetical protein